MTTKPTPKDDETSLDPRSTNDLLIQILQELQTNKGNDLNVDQTRHYQVRFPANSTDYVIVELNQPSEYFWIPSSPRAMTVSFGIGPGNPIATLAVGEPFLLRWPRIDALTFTPSAGTGAADSFELYASTRPIEIPTKIAGIGGSGGSGGGGTALVGYPEDSLHVSGDIGVEMLGVRNDNVATSFVGANGDYTPLAVSARGQLQTTGLTSISYGDAGAPARTSYDPAGNAVLVGVNVTAYDGLSFPRIRTPNIFIVVPPTAVTAGTGIVAWTPTAGKKFRLMGYSLSTLLASDIILCDHVVGAPFYRTGLLAAANAHESPELGNGFLSAVANNVLRIDLSASTTVAGTIYGTEE